MRRTLHWFLLCALILPSSLAVLKARAANPGLQVETVNAPVKIPPGADYAPDTILVSFKKNVPTATRLQSVRRNGLAVDVSNTNPDFARLQLGTAAKAARKDLYSVIAELRKDPTVQFAEPDYVVRASQAPVYPTDPAFDSQYGLFNFGQAGGTPDADSDAPEAWAIYKGRREVKVAVIDSGVDYNHEDLRDNCIAAEGFDYANNDADPMDDNGHGTRVAGVIGGRGGNGIGIAGVNHVVSLLPIKVLNNNGVGTASAVASGIQLAVTRTARVINLSLDQGSFQSSAILTQINAAGTQGILVVAAAGNNSAVRASATDQTVGADLDTTPYYPASYNRSATSNNVIAVASTDRNDALSVFSNYGANTVDIAAAGEDIVTTTTGGGLYTSANPVDGTSYAAAMVSGAAGLVYAANYTRYNSMSASARLNELKHRVLGTAEVLPTLEGKVVGARRLNIDTAIRATDTVDPGTPVNLRVIRRNSTSVIVRWIAAGDDGSTGTVTANDIRISTSTITAANFNAAPRVLAPSVVPGPVPAGAPQEALVAGLNGNTAYSLAVRPIDEMGRVAATPAVVSFTTTAGSPVLLLDDDATTAPAFSVAAPWAANQTDATAPSVDQRVYMDSPAGNYAANLNGLALTSTAPITLNVGTPTLSYTLKRTLGNTGDRLQVDISTDGGATYSTLRSFNTSAGYTTFADNLNAYIGQTIKIAFRLFTDGSAEADGVAIDHIQISGTQTALTTAYFDDAEAGSTFSFMPTSRGWAQSADDNFTAGGSFNYSDSPSGNYPNANPGIGDPANVFMYHPSTAATLVDFTPVLQFRARLQLETDKDYFYLRISSDGGLTFGEALRMTGLGNTAWTLYTLPLYGAYGKNVALMFQTQRDADTGSTQRDGVHIDDIRIGGETLENVGGALPNPPSALEAFPTSFTTVQLDWTDNADNETNFRVERRLQAGTFSQIALLPANTTTYSDTGLSANTTYEYRVRATNADGDSAYTANDLARTSVPATPSYIAGLGGLRPTSPSNVRFDYIDNSSDEPNSEGDQIGTGFVIERSDDNGVTFNQLALAPPSPSTGGVVYNDGTVLTGRSYIYRIKARNYVGDSAYSTTGAVRVASPLPPSNLTATLSGSNVQLNWVDASTDETGFIVERSVNADFGVPANIVHVTTTPGDATSTVDSGPLVVGTTYYYRVRARNDVGESTNSNIAMLSYRVPNDPSGLTVTVPAGSLGVTQLNLAWTDNSDNEANFQIRRSTTADFSAGVTTLSLRPANTTSTTDTGLTSSTTYYYQIRAVNTLGSGNYVPATPVTAPASGTTRKTTPTTPVSITATPLTGPARIDVSWVDGGFTEESFELEWSTDNAANWTLLHTVASTSEASNGTVYSFTHQTGVGQKHLYRVRALNGTGGSAYRTLATEVDMTLPAAPTNLTAVPLAGPPLQVQLAWQDNSDNESGFIIERSTDNFADPMNTVLVATTGVNATSRADTNSGSGLTIDTTYYYRVRATRFLGDSANSNTASTRTSVPAAPQNLNLSVLSNTQIQISFTDKSDNEDQFVIQRAPDNGMGAPGAFVDLPTVIGSRAGIDAVISHTDTNLSPLTTYWYRVLARNGVGDSTVLGPASATTLPNPPVEPTNLTAVVISATHVRLQWKDNSNNETMFEIERSTSGGAVVTTFTVGANDEGVNQFVTFNDDASGSVIVGNVYTYRVRAKNNNPLPSLWSNSVTADVTTPGSPSPLQATALNGSSIQLQWKDNSNNEAGFKIERSIDNFANPLNTTLVTTTGSGTTVLVDNNGGSGLTSGTTYYYRVRATNAVGDSANSNVAFATTFVVPGVPQSLQATALSGSQVQLNWTDGSSNETGFRIERQQGAGTWTLLPAIINPNVTTHVDTGLTANTQYSYRVYAFNLAGNSPTSNVATATTLGVPAAPTNLRLVRLSGNTVELAWDDNANNEQGFRLERRIGAAGTFSVVATLASNTIAFADSSLAVNTTYTYQVRAYNGVGNSSYSNALTVTTDGGISAPSNLTATALSGRRMLLRWTDNSSNETYFRIERSLGGGAFREVAAVTANVTQYVDSGLTSGSSYTYRVRAYRSGAGGGYSAYSNSASAVGTLGTTPTRTTRRKKR